MAMHGYMSTSKENSTQKKLRLAVGVSETQHPCFQTRVLRWVSLDLRFFGAIKHRNQMENRGRFFWLS